MDLNAADIEDAIAISAYITKEERYGNIYPIKILLHWDQTSTRYNLRRNRSQWINGHKVDLSWICNVAIREFVAAKLAEAQMASV